MIAELVKIIWQVEPINGDPLSEMLAPSELRLIAKTVIGSGLLPMPPQFAYPPHLTWMTSIPNHMHDCFSA